jgi:4-amino-4-deoxy-L-arabinose transferase-like glycosyltransferase
MTENKKSYLLLGALWALLLVLAAVRPLALPDEGRYTEVGRWMLMSGDWLTPRLNGIPFFHKPPLLHWLQATSMAIFGVGAWAARMVPAVHAGLMLLTVYLTARRVSSPAIARRAALMLGTSLSFLAAGQYLNHDMLVAAWIGIAIWSFALAFLHGERPHAGWARLGFAACALGVLAKGLIGLALPGLVLLLWLLATRQFGKVLRLPWLSGLAIFAAIALPWFVLAQLKYPDLLGYLFGVQQFGRYTGTTFNNVRPAWFYLPVLAGLFFPWFVFVLNQLKPPVQQAQAATDSIARSVWLLCWIWIVAIVGFFSVPNSKIVGYVLPVLPPLCLLAALGWSRWLGGHRTERALFIGVSLLAVSLGVVFTVVAGRYSARHSVQDIALTLACQAAPTDTVYAVGGYPYQLPFYSQSVQAMIVLQDWPTERQVAGDSWRRELFEGTAFDPLAGAVLQQPEVQALAVQQPGRWMVAPNDVAPKKIAPGWVLVQQGIAWSLWRSVPEPLETTPRQRLAGCPQPAP